MSRYPSRAAGAVLVAAAVLLPVAAHATPTGSPTSLLYPYAQCVSAPLDGGLWGATFGYVNTGDTVREVARGFNNSVEPGALDQDQPVTFAQGVHPEAFSTYFDPDAGDDAYVSWRLFTVTDVATTSSARCEREVAAPAVAGTLSVGEPVAMAGERVLVPNQAYDVTYRWYRDCDTADPVHVGDGRGYVVQAADAGHRLQGVITYARGFTAADGEAGVVGLRTSTPCNAAAEVAARPSPTITPAALAFPATALGDHVDLTASYVNTSALPASLAGATIGGPDAADFAVVDSPCSAQALPSGAACDLVVRFAPATAGTKTATLEIADDAGTREVPLHAVAGAPPTAVVAPVLSGTPALGRPLSVTPGQWAGDPTVTVRWDACTPVACGRVGSGATFVPDSHEIGHSIRAVVTATNDFGTDRVVTAEVGPVTGPPAAAAHLDLSAARLKLGRVAVHKRGKAKRVVISNSGGSPLVVRGVRVTGKHRKDVVLTTTCPGDTLAPGASCTVALRLRPAEAGRRRARLVVTTTVATRTVALKGTGVRKRR